MANIKYEVTRWDVSCCHHSHPTEAGYAESVILGITATDSESGKSAYKDERISISHCVELAQFEKESEQWIENQKRLLKLQSDSFRQIKTIFVLNFLWFKDEDLFLITYMMISKPI